MERIAVLPNGSKMKCTHRRKLTLNRVHGLCGKSLPHPGSWWTSPCGTRAEPFPVPPGRRPQLPVCCRAPCRTLSLQGKLPGHQRTGMALRTPALRVSPWSTAHSDLETIQIVLMLKSKYLLFRAESTSGEPHGLETKTENFETEYLLSWCQGATSMSSFILNHLNHCMESFLAPKTWH